MPEFADYNLSSYEFELEQELIAQHPSQKREDSKLLVLNKKTGSTESSRFELIGQYLSSGSLLVVNNTRVLPARLTGSKKTGGKVEFLLLTPLPLIEPEVYGSLKKADIECLIKSSKRPKPGDELFFPGNVSFKVLENAPMGRTKGELLWTGDLAKYFIDHGRVPLPPYIQREDNKSDQERYQTVYSSEEKAGSVAAPTAGLHFTPELKENLSKLGIGWAEVTLYVGYGTFSPVRVRDIREHKMHPEYIEVKQDAASKIRQARDAGHKIVAVGTTTVRTLESVISLQGRMDSYSGWTDLFVYPGYKFKIVDQLITNFHLPGSSLIMMVSALAGRENILKAYQMARNEKFRFFSYGDAMLIR
ncbi:MAG: tRNA preQ1(34) S-adenosylmethionine ribosyltransferase-isomerase QueA [Desulfonatronovibrio sp. MSAO_Bac4]|nr:MAG: tRNA preQ1(34) S-adenosylmethionine ribosyltransferase-isomerase QueA [Desulfonatronovibrio sp. MSAO_Bac4]